MKSNCLIFALTAWLRAAPPGEESYLLIRRSRVRWGLVHFLHGKLDSVSGQVDVVSFKPHTPEKQGIELRFRGRVTKGDAP